MSLLELLLCFPETSPTNSRSGSPQIRRVLPSCCRYSGAREFFGKSSNALRSEIPGYGTNHGVFAFAVFAFTLSA